MALKLIFMGTPDFAVPILKTIIEYGHKIVAVYTQNPKKSNRGQKINISPIHKFSNEKNLNVRTPLKLDYIEKNYIQDLKPDLVIVAAYGKIIPTKILNIKGLMFINAHASLLPKWRGAAPIQRSLMEMDKQTGISIMKIIPKLDAGPYILQEKMDIEIHDNYKSLSEKLSLLASKLILKSLNILKSNKLNFFEQEEDKATYAKKIQKNETKIEWNLNANQVVAKINALSPTPGAWFNYKNTRFKILKAQEVDKSGLSGKALDDKLTIACGKKAIKIIEIQKEGKQILKTEQFLAGFKIGKGEELF